MNAIVKTPANGKAVHKNNNDALPNITSWFDELFEKPLNTEFLTGLNVPCSTPAVNIKETNEMFIIEMAVPGLKKTDFNIELDNKLLIVSSETIEDNNEESMKFTLREFSYHTFKRTFTLPESINKSKIGATYVDGVLILNLPKREEAIQKPPMKIDIK